MGLTQVVEGLVVVVAGLAHGLGGAFVAFPLVVGQVVAVELVILFGLVFSVFGLLAVLESGDVLQSD